MCTARVDEDEAPRAVRRLRVALAEAALAEQRSLLIAGDPGNRNGRAEQARLGDHTARRHDRGQDRPFDPEEGEQLFVPLAGVELLQHRPRRVRHVDDVRTPVGQLPHEPRVDGPEGEAPLRASAPLEDPLQLRGREVGVGDESRALSDQVVRELRAPLRRPPVLPDDRALARASRSALQTIVVSRWFAIPITEPLLPGCRPRESVGSSRDDTLQDVLGIVLDPARLWEVLHDLAE